MAEIRDEGCGLSDFGAAPDDGHTGLAGPMPGSDGERW